jgi:hypothetical protein
MAEKPKHPGGRPPILDEEFIEEFVEAMHKVLVITHAAGMCMIHRDTVYKWIAQAKDDLANGIKDTLHVKFFYRLKKAQSDKIFEFVGNIAKRLKNWQANAWLLERCFREDFGVEAGNMEEFVKIAQRLQRELDAMHNKPIKDVSDKS